MYSFNQSKYLLLSNDIPFKKDFNSMSVFS